MGGPQKELGCYGKWWRGHMRGWGVMEGVGRPWKALGGATEGIEGSRKGLGGCGRSRGATEGVRATEDPPSAPPPCRYTGHRSTSYRLDCVLSEQDTHVGSASEDGNVYFWDLVEVSAPPPLTSVCPTSPPPHPTYFLPPSPQGSLALTLPVGRGVVQSIAFHPTLPCLLAATEGCVQLWREDGFEGDTTTT